MRMHSRKRKLTEHEIGICNPKQKKSSTRKACLPKEIHKSLIEKNKSGLCKSDEEHCLLDKATGISIAEKERLRKTYLRPRYPNSWESDPDDWLDNFNIQDVMKQYEETYPSFKFLGVLPIDFLVQNPRITDRKQCLYPDLCNINLQNFYSRGIRSFSIIFNLDPHYKGGSHWVALYCDINGLNNKNKNSKKIPWCAYFDSYGMETPRNIAIFMRSLCSQDKRMKLMYNARRFQYGNSECGMYSMYFIICMLAGINFTQFCKDSVSDQFMLRLRHLFFRK